MKYYITQAGRDLLNEGGVKARNKAKKRELVKKQGKQEPFDPTPRASIATRIADKHGQKPGAAAVATGRE
tara:strand:- start:60 stop:269 length:210 start_codon:yes stop_codon:yes gene_type:complete